MTDNTALQKAGQGDVTIGPALNLKGLNLKQIAFIGDQMARSGMFNDVKDGPKALVKILAGQEIGVTPFQAMTNIHIIQGKATLSANLMAAKVKGSGKYDYRVVKMNADECSIDFYQVIDNKQTKIGNSSFTLAEAKTAGTQNLSKFPRNMLFARAMSNGCKWFTPDVFNGNLVYTPEELGGDVDDNGNYSGRDDVYDHPVETKEVEQPTEIEVTPPKADNPSPSEGLEKLADEPEDTNEQDEEAAYVEALDSLKRDDLIELLKSTFADAGVTEVNEKMAIVREVIGKDRPTTNDEYKELILHVRNNT